MIWVSWRRQRAQLITLLGVLVVGAGAVILLRSNMVGAIDSSRIGTCVTQNSPECSVGEPASAFQASWTPLLNLAQAAILSLPVLIGVFIGAPLFARELEQGTHVLAFTQSVSRTRWMLSKLVVALAPALIVLIVLQYLVWWWLSAAGLLGPRSSGSFYFLNFGIEHVSPVAYALFAFALGAFVGAVSRRTLVAMTTGLAAFIAVRFALSPLVERLVPTQRLEVATVTDMTVRQDGSLVVAAGFLDASGQPVPSDRVSAVIQSCKSTPQGTGTAESQQAFVACLPKSGLAKEYADFVPESQAWQVHLVDAAIFGGLAVLLLVGTAWVLRRQS
jgi:ABC-type transport system involved in multi-copper enzyme maturation permease subunit